MARRRAAASRRREALAEGGLTGCRHSGCSTGGILANDTRPAEFIYDNLAIASTVVEAARRT